MNTPQAVTERYVSNFIHNGRNKDFDLNAVGQRVHVVDGDNCGMYFEVQVESRTTTERAVGATIAQAVRRALEKHGVTFR